MEASKIHSRYADIGHWLARCNHETGLIELNRRDFPRLTPLMQDYVWVHENVHLLYDVYDEDQCNAIADKIFVSRAQNAADREARIAFVNNSGDSAAFSGIAITAIVGLASTAISLGAKGYQLWKKSKASEAGYNGLSSGDRYLLAKELLKASFEAAPDAGLSAKDIFWGLMSQISSDADYEAWQSQNTYANGLVAEYEKAYGFGFSAVPSKTAAGNNTVKIIAIALMAAALVLVAIKLLKK